MYKFLKYVKNRNTILKGVVIKMDGNKNVLSGVACEVSDCSHNTEGKHCTAPSIKVGGMNAHTNAETECDTFKER